jgi:hypothetical protein
MIAGSVVLASLGRPTILIHPMMRSIQAGREAATRLSFMGPLGHELGASRFAPIVGGSDESETCHGSVWRSRLADAGRRHAPQPHFRILEVGTIQRHGPQMRNAIYGYLAEPEKQPKAAYMREVVMPGMARLLHRPPYDFTRAYDYNRSRVAFGCYHCHQVRQGPSATWPQPDR